MYITKLHKNISNVNEWLESILNIQLLNLFNMTNNWNVDSVYMSLYELRVGKLWKWLIIQLTVEKINN